MKRKALAIVLTLLMVVSILPMGAFAASYTDTEGHWAEKSIDRWTDAKVLEGMGNNTFAPDEYLTRAQAMTVFSRLLNLTEKADISKITDVAADAWYAPYIETGYAYQIIQGTSDTTFDPTGNITREQFFSVFARAVGIPPASTCDKTFTDLDQVSSWFVEEGTVYSMINRGYLNGYPDGSLKPQQYITRAEVAKVLDNAISDYITEDGTYPISGDGIVVVLAKDVKLTGNFNGHIVSSCADSTLDVSGVNGTPYIYVLGDNTKIIGAKPGTKVAVNSAADNVTANGVKVTYNPYVPGNPYIVPGPGGSSSSSSTPSYPAVQLSIQLGDKIPTIKTTPVRINSRYTYADLFDKVAAKLEDTSTDGDNKLITDAYDVVTADSVKKNGVLLKDKVLTMDGKNLGVDLYDEAEENFNEKVAEIEASGAIPATAQSAWNTFKADITPDHFFTRSGDDSMTYLTAAEYTTNLCKALRDLGELCDAVGPENVDKLFQAAWKADSNDTVQGLAAKNTSGNLIRVDGTISDGADGASDIANRLYMFKDNGCAAAVLDSSRLVGTFMFSLDIVSVRG